MTEAVYTFTPVAAAVSYLFAIALIVSSAYSVIISGTTFVKRIIITSVLNFLLDLFIFLTIMDSCRLTSGRGEPKSIPGIYFAQVPDAIRMVMLAIIFAFCMMRLFKVIKIQSTTITQFSVGDALEEIPQGVAIYGDEGIILQSSSAMDKLAYDVTGEMFLDGDKFWERIRKGDVSPGIEFKGGEDPVITKEDKTSWMFKYSPMKSAIGDLKQIIAVDITDEQKLLRELEEENGKLKGMNERLRKYNIMVDDTIRREELLAAKMRVHDQMGEELLAARMYIENDKSPLDGPAVYDRWKQNLNLLMQEAKIETEEKKDEKIEAAKLQVRNQIDRLMKAAEHLGIELQLAGDMPEDFDVMQLICVGIQECMTNAIQHANATQLFVVISQTMDEYIVRYSNNGDPVKLPIKEGGGLKLFRQSAEKNGATIEYVESTRFNMILTIPKVRPESI